MNGPQSRVLANLAPIRRAFMFVQETGNPRLQQGGVVRFAQDGVFEEPALNVGRQITPFANEGGAQTFQDSAFYVPQIADYVG
jgi:hypothetical protein